MRTAAMQHFIALATGPLAESQDPIVAAVRAAIEEGLVIVRDLTAGLTAKGFTVDCKPGEGHGVWLKVFDGEVLVAQAFGPDEKEALRQAIFAYVKETAAAAA